MTKEMYIKITGKIREDPEKIQLTKYVNRIFTWFVFLVYPVFLLSLLLRGEVFLWRAVLVPFLSFLAVTVFRRLLNVPRPYERFGIPPVLEKDTRGKSFPSRHVFSVFIIAMTVFYEYQGAGILLGVVGIGLGVIRIVGGVHEPRDVVAGALTGILCGLFGYYVI